MAVAGLLAQGASGLYADEVGKLDWHRQNLGRFSSAAFDGRGGVTVVGEVSLAFRGCCWVVVGRGGGESLVKACRQSYQGVVVSRCKLSAEPVSSRG